MTGTWSPLLVIRPDDGMARLEDSQSRTTEIVDRQSLVAQIVKGSNLIGTRTKGEPTVLNHPQGEWVSNGWRPSLEYFDWSEERLAPVDNVQAESPHADALEETASSIVWNWAEAAETISVPVRTVGQVLMGRRTRRAFDPEPLSEQILASILSDFAELLHTDGSCDGFLGGLRFAAIVYDVDGLTPGVWRIDLASRLAVLSRPSELRKTMSDLMCGMQAPMTASATMVLVADFPERQRRFPYERALRELYIDVGRVAQWLILACEFRDVGCLITPATNDRVLCDVLGLPPTEAPIYTVTFGRRRSTHHLQPVS